MTIKFREDLEIPFIDTGMLGYEDSYYKNIRKVKNHIFTATLKIGVMSRGRSSAKLHFVDKDTLLEYEMFLTDIEDMLKNATIQNGEVSGLFVFVKRGKNYGIKYAGPNIMTNYVPENDL